MSEIHFHLENATSAFVAGFGFGVIVATLCCFLIGRFWVNAAKEVRESLKESRKNFDLILKERDARIKELQQKLGAMQVAKIADDINAKIQKNKKP